MKWKVNKVVEAKKATRQAAEQELGVKITNTLYGDQGYIIDNKWIPEEALKAQAVPFNGNENVIKYAIIEIRQLQELLKGCKHKHRYVLIHEMQELIKLLQK